MKKNDIQKLLGVINSQIGEHKLPPKTLEIVFDKWWPDLEKNIRQILLEVDEPEKPIRSNRELLEEILQLTRVARQRQVRSGIIPAAIQDLLDQYIMLHDRQAEKEGDYQDTLDYLKNMHRPVSYIARRYKGQNDQLDESIDKFNDLSYSVVDGNDDDDNMPF